MNPTIVECLILGMLADISDHLQISGGIDPSFVKRALYGRHSWGLTWKYYRDKVPSSEIMPADAREVFDILAMWELIEQSAKNVSTLEVEQPVEEDKEALEFARFAGFDVQTEFRQVQIAEFMVEELDLFEGFKNRKLGLGPPSIGRYRHMVEVFKLFLASKISSGESEPFLLTSAQIKAFIRLGQSCNDGSENAFQKALWAKRHSAELEDDTVPQEVKAFIRECLQIDPATSLAQQVDNNKQRREQ